MEYCVSQNKTIQTLLDLYNNIYVSNMDEIFDYTKYNKIYKTVFWEKVNSHSGLIVFMDNKIYYIDNSSKNRQTHPGGGVEIHIYDSISDFQSDYGTTYESFYYLKINE